MGQDASTQNLDAQARPDLGFDDAGQSADSGPAPDAGMMSVADTGGTMNSDTGTTNPSDGGMTTNRDAGFSNPAVSTQISAIRAAANGPIQQMVDGAAVSYVKQSNGHDNAGFFIQGERQGPALFIRVDPNSLSPVPQAGSLIRFVATEKETNFDRTELTAISQYQMLRGIIDPATLVQGLSTANDLVSNVDAYESELGQLNATIGSMFSVAGQGWASAKLTTAGIPNDADFQIRMPTSQLRASGIGLGCQIELPNSPVWRYENSTQMLVMNPNDLVVTQCPAPQITNTFAQNNARVVVSLDRLVNPSTVQSNGSQIQLSSGVNVLSVKVYKRNLIIETSGFAASTAYTLPLDGTIQDYQGQAIDASGRSVQFTSIAPRAVLEINEVNLNITNGCDLIELRAVNGGDLTGYRLRNRGLSIIDLTGLTVLTNDYIVVHLSVSSPICNPNQAGNETISKIQNSRAFHANNFDNAYDWYSSSFGLARTDATLVLYDQNGLVMDAVLLSDDTSGTAATSSEGAAETVANVGEWTDHNGNIPQDGYYDDTFNTNAVQDLDGTSSSATGNSIQRRNDNDTDESSAWVYQQTATWGSNNLNQVNQ